MRKVMAALLVITLLLLNLSPLAVLAKTNGPERVDATDIELVKKITLKGGGAKGGKPAPVAATGIIGASVTGTKYAIVIGIEDYPGTVNDLQYTVDDADEMRDVLINKYGYSDTNIIEITNSTATFTNIYNQINYVKGLATAQGDEVVFFYSGHGAKGKANDGDRNSVDQCIVVWNDTKNGFDYIWDGQLVEWFSGFQTDRIIFIFDSCLSGGMSVLKAPGRVVNMACSATGYSYEGTQWGGGHGQFTYYFAEEGMENGLAENSSDNTPGVIEVTVEEAFDYAKKNCVSQSPVISDSFTNDLLP